LFRAISGSFLTRFSVSPARCGGLVSGLDSHLRETGGRGGRGKRRIRRCQRRSTCYSPDVRQVRPWVCMITICDGAALASGGTFALSRSLVPPRKVHERPNADIHDRDLFVMSYDGLALLVHELKGQVDSFTPVLMPLWPVHTQFLYCQLLTRRAGGWEGHNLACCVALHAKRGSGRLRVAGVSVVNTAGCTSLCSSIHLLLGVLRGIRQWGVGSREDLGQHVLRQGSLSDLDSGKT